jgi:hypothetical protein
MSIVIASIERNIGVRIFADRKLVVSDAAGKIYATNEIAKVYSISDTIACGITGDAQWGIELAQGLLNNAKRLPSELIKVIKKFPKPKLEGSTFTLIGIYDNRLPFIFGYMTIGKSQLLKNKAGSSIATSPHEYNNSCCDFFSSQKELGYSLDKCCVETIRFASKQNPDLISESYDSIEILL